MTTHWPVPLNLPETSLYADLSGIAEDLKCTIQLCTKLDELFSSDQCDLLLAEALEIAAVIRYGRCFASGVRSRVPAEVLDKLLPEQQASHQLFIELRNKYIAHSVNPFEENAVVAWVSDRPEETEIQNVAVHGGRIASFGASIVRELKVLAQAILHELQGQIEEEKMKVLVHARTLPYTELKNRPMLGAFNPSWNDVKKRR